MSATLSPAPEAPPSRAPLRKPAPTPRPKARMRYQGANEAVRKQIESLGTNLVVVLPGATTLGGARGGFGSASTLTVADAQVAADGHMTNRPVHLVAGVLAEAHPSRRSVV